MNYSEYFLKCQKNNTNVDDCGKTLYDFDICEKMSNKFTETYQNTIIKLSERVNKLFDVKQNYISNSMCHNLINIFELKEIEEISQYITPYLEKEIYKCNVHLDRVYIYRNIITNKPPETSWLWHWDHHPKEIIKVLIYLTDVEENTGPFEYLRHSKTNKCIKMPTNRLGMKTWGTKSPPGYPNSRVSVFQILEYINQGYERRKVVGKKGTTIIFDNNIIHRANIPVNKIRDVLVLQFRPSLEKRNQYFQKKWTGTFSENAVTKNPEKFVI